MPASSNSLTLHLLTYLIQKILRHCRQSLKTIIILTVFRGYFIIKIVMPRYFLEVFYDGAAYSGFQAQKNANTIQAETEKAFTILQKEKINMTGSSRTDAGVHGLQNFFHFDYPEAVHPEFVYKMNAILPPDIVVKQLVVVNPEAHCRFDAISREYRYFIYRYKDPLLMDKAFFFPYKLDTDKLQQAAEMIKE